MGAPVDVVTNAAGVYDFTMTVGTVPGTFPLNARAKDAAGNLITSDLRDTSPDQTLTVAPPGNWAPGRFLSELAGLKSDAAASKVLAAMTNDPASIAQVLSQLSGPGSKLGGLAYSLVSGVSGGFAVLVYGDTNPPRVDASGQVTGGDAPLCSPRGCGWAQSWSRSRVFTSWSKRGFLLRPRRSRNGPREPRSRAGSSPPTRRTWPRRTSSTTAGLIQTEPGACY